MGSDRDNSGDPATARPKLPRTPTNIYRGFGLITAIGFAAHFLLAAKFNDGVIFQRFGAFIIAINLVAFALIRGWLASRKRRGEISTFEYDYLNETFAVAGIMFAVIGTIIWGYGDLIPLFE